MEILGESLNQIKDALKNVQTQYIQWVLKNPTKSSDLESSIKLLSYLLHGQLKKSSVLLPELIYSSANVLGFFHDYLIRKHDKEVQGRLAGDHHRNGNGIMRGGSNEDDGGPSPSASADEVVRQREARETAILRIKSALTIVDYMEVFLEVSARHLWGEFGRWVVIILIQAIKTGLRAILLFHYKVGLVGSSSVQQRYRLKTRGQSSGSTSTPNVVFVLKHSGRPIRKVQYAPPVSSRDWDAPPSPEDVTFPQDLTRSSMIAEVIHLMRPLTHLASMGVFGCSSWKPWLISLSMDLSSLHLHSRVSRMSKKDKAEMTRRTYALCYYLMRSPFYDSYTKRRLLGMLNTFADRIPIIGNICGVLAQAIPEWQRTYSYMWTDY